MFIDIQRHQSTFLSLSPGHHKKTKTNKTVWRTLLLQVLFAACLPANAATLVASYSFNDSLAANEASAPDLLSIDPLGLSGFETTTVNGQNQRVFHWNGNGSDSAQNAGLQLNASGLVSYNNYSVELTFEFLEQAAFGSGWRRIIDTQNRQSDDGFYVDPSNKLFVYPVISGNTLFTTPGFHNVVLTNNVVNGTREVKAYLDGILELTSDSDQLNLDNPNNPSHLLHFFVDNLAGPAQQEFADGRIASLKLYDGIIIPTPVPAPSAGWLFASGLLGLLRRRT
ncbi:hypothetical protein [Methylomonas albis]|uniref:PEP-CTERM sorting domain-containing protein n=1 Tax=Methylomonas albis TaxID=1854563 RepID=A0ABR9D4N2_9GAMM|nr:PEP-CTERM sorting domain-containing protein [Methylomonas albis]MBD9358085.1 PEP-CTERM sorting domain-containing protein [Methylomonas albis]CAD6881448.1 hypothetical protein [Methylomonas albis]